MPFNRKYDIKVVVQLHLYGIEFFNYCDELIINNAIIPNIWVPINIAEDISLSVIDFETITNFTLRMSEKNGEWGYANIRDFNQGLFINDVIVTPLAAKYLRSRSVNDSGSLIFVRFEQDNRRRYKDYLFYGDYNIAYVIEHLYDKIITHALVHNYDESSEWKIK